MSSAAVLPKLAQKPGDGSWKKIDGKWQSSVSGGNYMTREKKVASLLNRNLDIQGK